MKHLQHTHSAIPQGRVCPLPVYIEALVQVWDLLKRHIDSAVCLSGLASAGGKRVLNRGNPHRVLDIPMLHPVREMVVPGRLRARWNLPPM